MMAITKEADEFSSTTEPRARDHEDEQHPSPQNSMEALANQDVESQAAGDIVGDNESNHDAVDNVENSSDVPPEQSEDSLPVASPVLMEEPPSLARLRRQQEQNRDNIPRAIPQDPEEEEKIRRRHLMWIASAIFLSLLILVGITLGVTLGMSPNESSTVPFAPTPSPTTLDYAELQELVKSISFDGGAALQNADSPQSKALEWLQGNANLDGYPDWKRIQRYALAVFYYSTNGDKWRNNNGWLSDEDECTVWFIQETSEEYPACHRQSGSFAHITLKKNNLNGTLPAELALLSNGLCKFQVTCVL